MPPTPVQVSEAMPSGPSDAVVEMVEYLTATFQWLTNLPHPVRDSAYFMSCAHINQGIVDFILSKRLPKVTLSPCKTADTTAVSHCCFLLTTPQPAVR